jgi:7,8-dihydropterin-6-yl-methyl-4-(beta-D-ribofuranosyl)aminobenzene 5'-phosphate synthase
LREADRLEVTVLVDNYSDVFLQGSAFAQRLLSAPPNLPLGEHGFSCLIKVQSSADEHIVLFDAGASTICLFHNAKLLNIDLAKIKLVALSHGHFDHYGALLQLLKDGGNNISLVLHPDALLERRLNIKAIGIIVDMGMLNEAELRQTGVTIHKIAEASTLADDLIMLTGEVERVTDFEKGFPLGEAKIDDKWVADSFRDDQGLVVNLKGKGLVVCSGCSHAGIINTIKYARKVSGVEKIHAVIGGFHLTGPFFEPLIDETVEEMKKICPDIIVPTHCTGWKAINRFVDSMPQQCVLDSVGTRYVFQ